MWIVIGLLAFVACSSLHGLALGHWRTQQGRSSLDWSSAVPNEAFSVFPVCKGELHDVAMTQNGIFFPSLVIVCRVISRD